MAQLERFLSRLLAPVPKTGLPLIGNLLKTLAKSVFRPLGVTTTASATDVTIQKNIFGLSTAALIFSNEDLNDIMKIVTSLKNTGLSVSEKVEN